MDTYPDLLESFVVDKACRILRNIQLPLLEMFSKLPAREIIRRSSAHQKVQKRFISLEDLQKQSTYMMIKRQATWILYGSLQSRYEGKIRKQRDRNDCSSRALALDPLLLSDGTHNTPYLISGTMTLGLWKAAYNYSIVVKPNGGESS